MSFKKVHTLTTQIFKKKRGKCPYCGKVTRIEDKKRGCRHLKAKAPTDDGTCIWKFERKVKPMRLTKQGRILHRSATKQMRQKLYSKVPALDSQMVQYEQAKQSDQELVKQHMEQMVGRGGRKSKVYIALEGLEEYLKPKYKRQLTLWKKLKQDKSSWLLLEPIEKRVIDGRIKTLSHKIKEAKKQKKQKEQWARYK